MRKEGGGKFGEVCEVVGGLEKRRVTQIGKRDRRRKRNLQISQT